MKFSAAVLAFAVGAAATKYQTAPSNSTKVSYVTEVVDSYKTYCSSATTITYGTKTYTVTEPTTLTIEGPCTISKPVYTTSYVECKSCSKPTPSAPSVYYNGTSPAPTGPVKPTGVAPSSSKSAPSSVPTAGAGKMAALTGAGLAGVLGLAAAML